MIEMVTKTTPVKKKKAPVRRAAPKKDNGELGLIAGALGNLAESMKALADGQAKMIEKLNEPKPEPRVYEGEAVPQDGGTAVMSNEIDLGDKKYLVKYRASYVIKRPTYPDKDSYPIYQDVMAKDGKPRLFATEEEGIQYCTEKDFKDFKILRISIPID